MISCKWKWVEFICHLLKSAFHGPIVISKSSWSLLGCPVGSPTTSLPTLFLPLRKPRLRAGIAVGVLGIWWGRWGRTCAEFSPHCLAGVYQYFQDTYAWKYVSSDLFFGFKYFLSLSSSTMLFPLGSLPINPTYLSWMNLPTSSHPYPQRKGRLYFLGISGCIRLQKREKMQKELVGGQPKTQVFNFTVLPRRCEHRFQGGWNHNFQCQNCSWLFLW